MSGAGEDGSGGGVASWVGDGGGGVSRGTRFSVCMYFLRWC